MTKRTDDVRIGRVVVPFDTATKWIRDYTDEASNLDSEHPYAFPAYDQYDGGTTDPAVLTDGDLLSPMLLNVQVKLRAFYGLQRARSRLQEALSDPLLETPLAEIIDDRRLRSAVRGLYGPLDESESKPWGVGATTLSKVLHRKRPHSVVLHDRWVRACYVGDEAPVPRAKNRSWADYMVLITEAIRHDIATQHESFTALAEEARTPRSVSHVRILDILAWSSRGDAPAEEAEEAFRRG